MNHGRRTRPSISESTYVHPSAVVIGDVTLGERVSVWPAAVIRGDTDRVEIGDESNVQDGTVIHVDHGVPTVIGKRVGIGHRAIVHGATVRDDVLIGMGAVVLNRAVIGSGSIIGAGSVITEGMEVPPNSLVVGVPGRVIRETTIAERERIASTVRSYLGLQDEHRAGKWLNLETAR
jgi:carbonic anhydrase/acetyltransferase-like protein (isoleucine patch superfamily)